MSLSYSVQHMLLSLYAVYPMINTIHASLVSMQYLFALLFLYSSLDISVLCSCPLSHVCSSPKSCPLSNICPSPIVLSILWYNPVQVYTSMSIIHYKFGSSCKSSRSSRSITISIQSYQSCSICSIISNRSILSTSYGQSDKENNSIS
mgnify:CR=1 FL=1